MICKNSTKNITQSSINVLTFWAKFAIIETVNQAPEQLGKIKKAKLRLCTDVAVELIHGKDEVPGSNPGRGSIQLRFYNPHALWGFFGTDWGYQSTVR